MAPLGYDLHSRSGVKEFRSRLFFAIWCLALVIVLLMYRLYTLQVLRGEELSTKGRRNFVQKIQIPHDRGIIYDRYGRILVDNRPSLDLQITPAFLGKPQKAQETLVHLAELLNMPNDELQRISDLVKSRRGLERFRALNVRRDLDATQVEAIEGERSIFLLDGVEIVEGRRRTYHYGALAAHMLGYVNEIDATALDVERARGNPEHYDLGDMIGREGLERTYEKELRGIDGTDKIVVDAKGRRQQLPYVDFLLGEQRRVEPRPGHNIYLTLDLDLQKRAEEIFLKYGNAGSVVALDPRTGAVLVLASIPAYDANLVSGSLAKEIKEKLDKDPLKPWINRPIQGQYAPGSTFKVVTALAALMEHATNEHEHVLCPGHFRMGKHVWRCWRDSGHGMVDLHTALRISCDTFFYIMASRMGIDPIAHMARLLGFGARTGIALRWEQPGIAPDEAFHARVDAQTGGYQRGMAINTSIGQGSLLVTPLQLATAYAAIANGKEALVPQMMYRIETADKRVTRRFLTSDTALVDSDGVPRLLSNNPMHMPVQSDITGNGPMVLQAFQSQTLSVLNIPEEFMQHIHRGLKAVTSEQGGTGYYSRSRKVSMAGKTGTAQVVHLGKERLKGWQVNYFERDHAWYVAYAPADDPQIVIAVLNEHAGHGGSAAAPVAVAVIDAFFELQEARAKERHALQ